MIKKLFKLIVVLAGVTLLLGLADYFLTSRALQGVWQFQPKTLDDKTSELLLGRSDAGGGKSGGGTFADKLGRQLKKTVTQVGSKIMGEVASSSKLLVGDGGYRVDGPIASVAAVALYGLSGGPRARLEGCETGSFLAACPFVRVTCGDGSGRSMWFLMRGWPSEQLEMLPLPVGNEDMQKRFKEMASKREKNLGQIKAGLDLLTLHFRRIQL